MIHLIVHSLPTPMCTSISRTLSPSISTTIAIILPPSLLYVRIIAHPSMHLFDFLAKSYGLVRSTPLLEYLVSYHLTTMGMYVSHPLCEFPWMMISTILCKHRRGQGILYQLEYHYLQCNALMGIKAITFFILVRCWLSIFIHFGILDHRLIILSFIFFVVIDFFHFSTTFLFIGAFFHFY